MLTVCHVAFATWLALLACGGRASCCCLLLPLAAARREQAALHRCNLQGTGRSVHRWVAAALQVKSEQGTRGSAAPDDRQSRTGSTPRRGCRRPLDHQQSGCAAGRRPFPIASGRCAAAYHSTKRQMQKWLKNFPRRVARNPKREKNSTFPVIP